MIIPRIKSPPKLLSNKKLGKLCDNLPCIHFSEKTIFNPILAMLLALSIYGCGSYRVNSFAETPEDVASPDIDGEDWSKVQAKKSLVKGWDYISGKLVQSGIPRNEVTNIFSSEEMPYWTPIPFKVRPIESQAIYRGLNSKQAHQNALQFYNSHKKYFQKARARFGVEPEIILAILQIETQCGKNTGNEPVFYWLSRLVSAGFPPNLSYNLRTTKEIPKPSYQELKERSEWLEEEFMPHILSLITMSKALGVSPMSIKGSKGGAIGLPQFLPGNIKKFGIDGDGNGAINIFVPADAIFSVANFLNYYGWKNGINLKAKTNVILEYNRSSAYADTVLKMASELKRKM
ncbi:MAG TPA: lytic murein transglycosylase [Oligoflexia bacterium]|nr:lytic murein transglycosylase [Oligoflexia bacterium]HMP47136.1 lytic murein transglycosylase [Oligoflexia bacterium]